MRLLLQRAFEQLPRDEGQQVGLQRHRLLHQRQLAFHRAFDQRARDEQTVDLVRAFENPVDPGVPIDAFNPVLLNKAVPAVNLHALIGDEIERFRAEHFVDRALERIFRDCFRRLIAGILAAVTDFGESFIEQTGRPVHHALQDEGADVHIRQLGADQRKG